MGRWLLDVQKIFQATKTATVLADSYQELASGRTLGQELYISALAILTPALRGQQGITLMHFWTGNITET